MVWDQFLWVLIDVVVIVASKCYQSQACGDTRQLREIIDPPLYVHDKPLSWIHTQTQSVFSSLSRMRISVFEVMSVYPIYQYQNAISRVMPLHELKKCSTSRAFQAYDTRFYRSSVNALQERFIAERWHWVWTEALQLTTQHWKNAHLSVWIQLNNSHVYSHFLDIYKFAFLVFFRVTYDLHKAHAASALHANPPAILPWLPLDQKVPLLRHMEQNTIPMTFPPRFPGMKIKPNGEYFQQVFEETIYKILIMVCLEEWYGWLK